MVDYKRHRTLTPCYTASVNRMRAFVTYQKRSEMAPFGTKGSIHFDKGVPVVEVKNYNNSFARKFSKFRLLALRSTYTRSTKIPRLSDLFKT